MSKPSHNGHGTDGEHTEDDPSADEPAGRGDHPDPGIDAADPDAIAPHDPSDESAGLTDVPSELTDRPEELTAIEKRALAAAADDEILAQMLDEERVESESIDTALLWRLLRYCGPHIGLASVAVLLAIVEAVLMTLPAWLIGIAIDAVGFSGTATRDSAIATWIIDTATTTATGVAPDADPRAAVIVFFGAVVSGVWLVRWLTAVTTTYLMQMLGQRVVHDLRVDVFRHISSMDMTYFQDNPVGRLVNRTTFDVQSISELFSDAFAQGLRDVILIAVLLAVMFTLDVPLAFILVGMFPLLVITALVYRHFGRPAMRTMQAVSSRMNAWLAENLSGMRENQLYRREEKRREEFVALTDAHQTSVRRVIQAWGLLRPVMMLISAGAMAVILLVGYERVAMGAITVGVLLTSVRYTTRLWRPVRNLTEKYNLIQRSLTAGERVMDVLDTPSSMADAADADPNLDVQRGEIEFDGVRFAYPSKPDVEVLRGIDFAVQPGEKVALVGDTGAGKSTITHLISRFYDPVDGDVRIDGRSTRDYTLEQLRAGIALVPQDVVIFAGTLRDNIALGADVDDSVLMDAARAVCAERLIDGFDDGLDHVMEEGGRTLSTGERQLLSFARALVANPPILILDEATASVDTQTEQIIQDALIELTAGRTSIVIAHRLSTIRDADCILVLRHGQVVERGTHDELLASGGEYARLYELHLRDEESGGDVDAADADEAGANGEAADRADDEARAAHRAA